MTTSRETAALVIDNIPQLMRLLRTKLREKRSGELSMAQFRTLAFVDSNRGASLSEAAGHIGLSLPAMSRLVDSLVDERLLTRTSHGVDRRRICLGLTPSGKRELQLAYRHAETYFAEKFEELSGEERVHIADSLNTLRRLFMLEAGNGKDALHPQRTG